MGWYVRKAFNLGPLRLNLSRGGVGLSFGVRGARISTGPRGTYVHAGREGLYYRSRIDSPLDRLSKTAPSSAPATRFDDGISVEGSPDGVVAEINERLASPTFVPHLVVGTAVVVVAIGAGSAGLANSVLGTGWTSGHPLVVWTIAGVLLAIVGLGGWIAYATAQQEEEAKTTSLAYTREEGVDGFPGASFLPLLSASKVWRSVGPELGVDKKYHAGASRLVQRVAVPIDGTQPPFVRVDVPIVRVSLGRTSLYFLPDQILVHDGRRYSALRYAELSVHATAYSLVEAEDVPADAIITGTSWRHANRDGSPDKRFADNVQLPIVEYGELVIAGPAGFSLRLVLSARKAADQIASEFRRRSWSRPGR